MNGRNLLFPIRSFGKRPRFATFILPWHNFHKCLKARMTKAKNYCALFSPVCVCAFPSASLRQQTDVILCLAEGAKLSRSLFFATQKRGRGWMDGATRKRRMEFQFPRSGLRDWRLAASASATAYHSASAAAAPFFCVCPPYTFFPSLSIQIFLCCIGCLEITKTTKKKEYMA